MATTYEINNLPASSVKTLVDCYKFDNTKWQEITPEGETAKLKANQYATYFTYADGDASLPEIQMRVLATVNSLANGGFGSINYSVKFTGTMRITVDAVVVADHPIDAVLAFTVPGLSILNSLETMQFLSALFYALHGNTSASAVPGLTILDKLARKITKLYNNS